jgi:hypothetical protein
MQRKNRLCKSLYFRCPGRKKSPTTTGLQGTEYIRAAIFGQPKPEPSHNRYGGGFGFYRAKGAKQFSGRGRETLPGRIRPLTICLSAALRGDAQAMGFACFSLQSPAGRGRSLSNKVKCQNH